MVLVVFAIGLSAQVAIANPDVLKPATGSEMPMMNNFSHVELW